MLLRINIHFFLSVEERFFFLSVFPNICSDSHNEFGSAVLKSDSKTCPEVMEQPERPDWSDSLLLCFLSVVEVKTEA